MSANYSHNPILSFILKGMFFMNEILYFKMKYLEVSQLCLFSAFSQAFVSAETSHFLLQAEVTLTVVLLYL